MAKQGKVKLVGRFRKGQDVQLKKAPHDGALRAGAAEIEDTQTVDDDGTLEFKGLEVGQVYFAVGVIDGGPVEVRLTARESDYVDSTTEQAPIQPDRIQMADKRYVDEKPTKESKRDLPKYEAAPGPSQQQVPEGVAQRTDTPFGQGYPVDPTEQSPYRRQEDVPDNVPQMSDTETGQATEIVRSTQRQEDVYGVPQRSDTPHGQAYPLPEGGPIEAALEKDSSAAKESRGGPVRAAAEPLGEVSSKGKKPDAVAAVRASGAPNERDNLSGTDAQGQPIYDDVAANLGIAPAKKPLGDKSVDDAPDAKPGEDPLARLDDPADEAGPSKTKDASTGAGSKTPSDEPEVSSVKVSKAAQKKREGK